MLRKSFFTTILMSVAKTFKAFHRQLSFTWCKSFGSGHNKPIMARIVFLLHFDNDVCSEGGLTEIKNKLTKRPTEPSNKTKDRQICLQFDTNLSPNDTQR